MTVAELEHFDTGTVLAEALAGRLALRRFPMLAFTGGGGKTSLMFSLARVLSKTGRTVVTTTTKIFPPTETQSDETFVGPLEETMQKIENAPKSILFTAARAVEGGKLAGYAAREVDALLKKGAADCVLVEADGARRRPLKAYAEWEPPVPPLATAQFIVVGADAFTQPLSEETVCRFENFTARTGLKNGGVLNVEKAAALFSDAREYLKNSPPQATRIFFLNKTELLADGQRNELTTGLAKALKGYDRLIAASVRENKIYADILLKRG